MDILLVIGWFVAGLAGLHLGQWLDGSGWGPGWGWLSLLGPLLPIVICFFIFEEGIKNSLDRRN